MKYGDIAVKLSNISRQSSFSKLKKKFGEYQERKNNVIIQTPLKNFSEKNDFNSKSFSWEKYQAEKNNYSKIKSDALKKLRERQKIERENLFFSQKKRRKEIFSKNWRGRGNELNQLRSLFAFVHRKEQLELRERQREEIQELKSHFLRRFPPFKDWLTDQNQEDLSRRTPATTDSSERAASRKSTS